MYHLNAVSAALILLLGCNNSPSHSPLPQFVDVSAQVGLQFTNVSGSAEQHYIAESASAGSAFLDYDGDGYLDLFFVNGTRLEQPSAEARNRLFRNEGGSFREVPVDLGPSGWGMGCAVGDFDNDGDPDVYATYLGPNRLYRNDDGQVFSEVAQAAGVADESWGSSAAFGDLDGDGLLDLYVANYVAFDVENPPSPAVKCPYKGLEVFCGPGGFTRQPDRVYANAGAGRFIDKSAATGLDQYAYPGLGVVFGDLDADGDLDIYVANDTAPNLLLRNDGAWQLTEIGIEAGVAFSGYGKDQAGMGVHSGDFDRDGRLDLFVTNFSNDVNTLYRNEGALRFTDATYEAGLGGIALPYLGWGTGFFDFDNDGWLDLFVANGHLYPQLNSYASGLRYAQRNLLYQNREGRFAEVGGQMGAEWAVEKVSRAASLGDLDNDGDVDLLIVNLNDTPTLLRNDGGNRNNWLGLKLIGSKSNRDAIGAQVRVRADGLDLVREVHRGYGFQAGHDRRLLIGLGAHEQIDAVEIRWPAGRQQVLKSPPLRRYLEIHEGRDEVAVVPRSGATGREEEVPTDQPTALQAQPTTDSFPVVGEPHWQADDYLKASKALFAAARYGEVRTVLEQGLRQTPDSLPLRFHLGLLLVTGLGHYEEGAQVLEDAVRDYPTSVDSHFYLGRAYLGLNRLAEAIQSFERAVALVPSSWEYYTWLGLANMRADSLQAAAAAFEQAAEQAPWEPNPHLQLVSVYNKLGRTADAQKEQQLFERFFPLHKKVKNLRQRLEVMPQDASAHSELGTAYGRQGRLAEALASFQRAVELDPQHGLAHLGMGTVLFRMGQPDRAILSYEQACRVQPDLVEAYQDLGYAYAARGRLREAIAMWEQLLQQVPDHPNAHRWIRQARAQSQKR